MNSIKINSENSLIIRSADKLTVKEVVSVLKKEHQFFLNKLIPELENSLFQFNRNLQEVSWFTLLLNKLFQEYKYHFLEHLEKEEQEVFPFAIELENAYLVQSSWKTSKRVLTYFVEHDDKPEEDLKQIINWIEQQVPEVNSMISFNMFKRKLEHATKRLEEHAKTEDELLMPKLRSMEKVLLTID